MKKTILIGFLTLFGMIANACPVCEKQQPKVLRGITHGTGPDSQLDYVIIAVTVLIVLLSLFYSVKWIIHPGEKSENHIKNLIINLE
ncbi:hypothetical protein [Pedobacter immunditicola]|uniref:hypothetical protein n=1 Tax=Pedobacter immunditicola TaxID=3133440 RepID=UPI0030B2A38A